MKHSGKIVGDLGALLGCNPGRKRYDESVVSPKQPIAPRIPRADRHYYDGGVTVVDTTVLLQKQSVREAIQPLSDRGAVAPE